jgi:hypothetical protein
MPQPWPAPPLPESSPEQHEDDFDPNFDFLRLVTSSQLSKPEINAFIEYISKLVDRSGGDLTDTLTLKNADAVYKHRESLLLSLDDGWEEHDIVVTPEDAFGALQHPVSFTFHCRDIAKLVEHQCSNPDFKDSFVLHPKKEYKEVGGRRQRIYSEVYNCDAAINAYKKVKDHAGDVRPDWETMGTNATVALLQTIRSTAAYGGNKSSKAKPQFDHCKATLYRSRGVTAGQTAEATVQVRALFWCSINTIVEPFAFVYEMKAESNPNVNQASGSNTNVTTRNALDKFGCTAYELLPPELLDRCPNEYKVIPLSALLRLT